MRKFFLFVMGLISVILIVGFVMTVGGLVSVLNPPEDRLREESLLQLNLDGVIQDGAKFLEMLRKYREEDRIKGVLVQLNSPGGVVGPSQEIFLELKRTREEFKKPVIVSCLGLAASGAYYAAVGADKIVVTPGCMIGSIGVIMQFANLERLLNWAKIERYALKTGKFKDTGAEYRAMAPEEKALLQEMLDDVLDQFKTAIADGRKMPMDIVNRYADGRVFTGAMAVKLGFADAIGTLDDAKRLLGEMTGLGAKPKIFKPRPNRSQEWLEMLGLEEEGQSQSLLKMIENTFQTHLQGRPLLIWPGALGS